MSDALRILGDSELVECSSTPPGSATKASEVLADRIALLYFSAHWCPPCRAFTPVLAKLYKKLKAEGKDFEIVFVSLDKDEKEFQEYIQEMPWLAVPFADENSRKELAKNYKARGIPHLVVLDTDGSVISNDGTEEVREDEGGERFPWRPPSFAEIWPSSIITKTESGEEVRVASSDLSDKYLMLYFSAHWCPPCRRFTPTLSAAYKTLRAQREDFELVFVSSDRDTDSFKEYFGEMTFGALPYEDRAAKAGLSRRFGVSGIPKLIILGHADERGERPLINDNIRSVIEAGDFSEFPFHKKNYGDLEAGEDLNDKKCLIVFDENGDDDNQEEVKEALREVAKKLESKQDMSFYWSLGAGGIGQQVRKLTEIGDASDKPAIVLLNIPDEGGFYVGNQHSEVTVENLLKFIEAPGQRRQLGVSQSD